MRALSSGSLSNPNKTEINSIEGSPWIGLKNCDSWNPQLVRIGLAFSLLAHRLAKKEFERLTLERERERADKSVVQLITRQTNCFAESFGCVILSKVVSRRSRLSAVFEASAFEAFAE